MSKAELAAKIAAETGLNQTQAQKTLTTVIDKITKTLKKDGRFALFGLGVFAVVKRAKRQARNPRTGEPVTIKAHRAVKFKPAKTLKDAVN